MKKLVEAISLLAVVTVTTCLILFFTNKENPEEPKETKQQVEEEMKAFDEEMKSPVNDEEAVKENSLYLSFNGIELPLKKSEWTAHKVQGTEGKYGDTGVYYPTGENGENWSRKVTIHKAYPKEKADANEFMTKLEKGLRFSLIDHGVPKDIQTFKRLKNTPDEALLCWYVTGNDIQFVRVSKDSDGGLYVITSIFKYDKEKTTEAFIEGEAERISFSINK